MTQAELILDIQNELTFAKALPYSIPEQEIVRIITIAERYFYDNWRHAIEPRYLLLPLAIFSNPLFRKERTIKKVNIQKNLLLFYKCNRIFFL